MNNRAERLCKCRGHDQDTSAFGHVTAPAERNSDIAVADRSCQMRKIRQDICGRLKVNLKPGVASSENAWEETRALKRHIERINLAVESECINRALQSRTLWHVCTQDIGGLLKRHRRPRRMTLRISCRGRL